jgi:chromosomal replication initiation ATPase DnaA
MYLHFKSRGKRIDLQLVDDILFIHKSARLFGKGQKK